MAIETIGKYLNAADSLQNVVAGLGTSRDKRHYSRYDVPRGVTRFDAENMYRGSWLAKRIVNTPADDMTREWRSFNFADSDDNADQEAIEQAEKKFCIKAKVNEALRWARLYGGCLIIIGTDDVTKGASDAMAKPLDVEKLGKDCLRYIQVVDRWFCAPTARLTSDITDPNFFQPETYVLSGLGAIGSSQTASAPVEIHHSRVIKFDGEKLPRNAWLQNGMWHDSSLLHVHEALMDCDTVTAGIATMIFESNVDVIQSDQLTNLLATAQGEAKITKRWQLASLMKSFNRVLLLDGSEKYEKKANSFTNLADIWDRFQTNACGAARMPAIKLFGESAPGLSSTGDTDLRNYYDEISSEQEANLRPQLEYLDQILVRSALGSIPADYEFKFNPLWQSSDVEQSTIDWNNAQRDNVYLTQHVATPGLVASELKARGTYRTMSNKDVKDAQDMFDQAQERSQQTFEQTTQQNDVKAQLTQAVAGDPKKAEEVKQSVDSLTAALTRVADSL